MAQAAAASGNRDADTELAALVLRSGGGGQAALAAPTRLAAAQLVTRTGR